MSTNTAGLKLIKEFEGLSLVAYPDPATKGEPWTIGYGHTSMAGSPKVVKGMKISLAEADEILRRDLKKYEKAVEEAILVDINPNQFSACVSLCYNIGPANFKKSSVVRFINKKMFNEAANAFKLWNKANGKVMGGLTRRRAAEAALFLLPGGKNADLETTNIIPDVPKGKSMVKSTTNIAASVSAVTGAAMAVNEATRAVSGGPIITMFGSYGTYVPYLAIGLIVAGALWIVYERHVKSRDFAI